MKPIVILDSYAVAPHDLNWQPLLRAGLKLRLYDRTRYEQAAQRIGNAECVIADKVRFDEALLSACPHLRWIGLTGTGTDRVDLQACRRRGIAVANVPDYCADSVAQLTWALLLTLVSQPVGFYQAVKNGYTQGDALGAFGLSQPYALHGKTLGLVGLGSIGQAVARIASAFGMQVLYTCRRPVEHVPYAFHALKELLAQSDVVSLHCPLTDSTRQLINADTLRCMKRGAVLLNTARGALTDEAAVCSALFSGALGGYGADCAVHEPLRAADALLHAPRTVITPHIAWASPQALEKLSQEVCENLLAFLRGEHRNFV